MTRTPLSRSEGQRSRSPGHFGWLFKSQHNLSRRQQFICRRPESPLARGGGIVWLPHYRPHSLLVSHYLHGATCQKFY